MDQLAAIDTRAGDLMREWVEKNGTGDIQAMADYAYALVQKYGEASAALSAEMYDATAEAQGATLPPAVPAEPAGYGEVAKTMYGIRKQSLNPESYASGVSRLVKRTGADTTLHNALRDGAEFAWVPFGDTCPFCIALASRGWQKISEKALKNGHAEHIHANCNCGYMTRQDGKSGVAGYDPQKYLDMYYGAEGSTPSERINSMRRMHYEQNKDLINAQKREAYHVGKIKHLSSDPAQSGTLWKKLKGTVSAPTKHTESRLDYNQSEIQGIIERARAAGATMSGVRDSLSDEEIRALQKYIGFDSYMLNEKLRNWDKPGNELTEEERKWARNIDIALFKLPDYTGVVYRSISIDRMIDEEAFSQRYQPGAVVLENAFISSSKEYGYDDSFEYQMIIQSKHGKDISELNPDEREVLFKRGSMFIVTKREGTTIYLEEV